MELDCLQDLQICLSKDVIDYVSPVIKIQRFPAVQQDVY